MSISLEDPGFRWGLGVFETVRVEKGVPLFHQLHLENIAEAADVLGLPMPEAGPWRKPPGENGIWRWYLTPDTQEDRWEEGLPDLPDSYRLALSPRRLDSGSWEARYKTLSYLLRLQARREAETDEVVLLNETGMLASASMANLYWVLDGKLHTPALDCGCRDGVVRQWLLESWPEAVMEGLFPPAVLEEAEEIFVSNSRVGIMPVTDYAGRELKPGPQTRRLQELYRESITREVG